MSEPLYLKYRPQKLSELVGQEIISRTLTNAIKIDRIAHAYFFTGPRGCGKTSTARIIAKSLNCKTGPTADPCGECQNCLEIARGISPDVIEIDAASHRSVEDATQVIERCHLAPQTAKHKIYILDEVHMLSKEAFNALLKTIEEPPANVVFILATTEEHKVPQTIVSRCQRFSFRPIDNEPLIERLKYVSEQENIKLTDRALLRIAKQSKGGLRDALSLLDQVSILAPDGELIEEEAMLNLFGGVSEDLLKKLLDSLLKKETNTTLEQINCLLEQGIDPIQIAKNLIEFAVDTLEKEIAQSSDVKDLIYIVDQLTKAEYSLRNSSQASTKLKSSLLAISLGFSQANNEGSNELIERIEKLEQQISNFNSGTVQNSRPKPIQKDTSEQSTQNIKQNESLKVNSVQSLKETTPTENIQTDNQPSSSTQQSQDGILNILIANLKHVPTKAAIQGGKVFVLSESSDEESYSVVFGVPLKTFHDKLSDPKKVKIIEETLSEELDKTVKVSFEINSNAPKPSEQVQSSNQDNVTSQHSNKASINKEPEQFQDEKPKYTNSQLSNDSDNEILSNAEHILGAKIIN